MAYTSAELDAKIVALETALSRGELRVDFADRSVTYRSVTETVQALEYFKGLLTNLTASTNRSRQSFGVAARGF